MCMYLSVIVQGEGIPINLLEGPGEGVPSEGDRASGKREGFRSWYRGIGRPGEACDDHEGV